MVCLPVRRDNLRALASAFNSTGEQTMLGLTCIMISSVDLACYGYPELKTWVYRDCNTILSRQSNFCKVTAPAVCFPVK